MFNKWIGAGRLTKDPEIRYAQSGTAVCNFTLATTTGFGEKARTLFARCTCFGKTAEAVEKYTHKGSKVLVDAEVQSRSYEKDHKTHWITEFTCNSVQFLDNKPSSDADNNSQKKQDQNQVNDDDIPF